MPDLQEPNCELAVGDRAPNFVLPAANGKGLMFYDHTKGARPVLLFTPGKAFPRANAVLQAFAGRATDITNRNLVALCVSLDSIEDNATLTYPALIWSDPARAITAAYRRKLGLPFEPAAPDDEVTAVLLDANQRLLACLRGTDASLAGRILDFYDAQPPPEAAEVRPGTAPVLMIPRVLSPEMCQALIDQWHVAGHEEGGVLLVTAGVEQKTVRHDSKKRLDHDITDRRINGILQRTIGRRIGPELEKAFRVSGFRFDQFFVVCYDAARGDYFKPHRDNTVPSTADRLFALTINLNTEEYDGGDLVFPEYSEHSYRPPSGGAIIFSCALIHAARTPTKGRRFALLSFLKSLPAAPGKG